MEIENKTAVILPSMNVLEWPSRAGRLDVVIPHLSPDLTSLALDLAANLGQGLDGRFRLIDVRVVPYSQPLQKSFVRRKKVENDLQGVADTSVLAVSPELVFSRDWETGFRRTLRPHSLVLIPFRKQFWNSHDKRMAERLRKHGHQVIWLECP